MTPPTITTIFFTIALAASMYADAYQPPPKHATQSTLPEDPDQRSMSYLNEPGDDSRHGPNPTPQESLPDIHFQQLFAAQSLLHTLEEHQKAGSELAAKEILCHEYAGLYLSPLVNLTHLYDTHHLSTSLESVWPSPPNILAGGLLDDWDCDWDWDWDWNCEDNDQHAL